MMDHITELAELYGSEKKWYERFSELFVLCNAVNEKEAFLMLKNLSIQHSELSKIAVVARASKQTRALSEAVIKFHNKVLQVEGLLIIGAMSK